MRAVWLMKVIQEAALTVIEEACSMVMMECLMMLELYQYK